jgi:hypothetical protein
MLNRVDGYELFLPNIIDWCPDYSIATYHVDKSMEKIIPFTEYTAVFNKFLQPPHRSNIGSVCSSGLLLDCSHCESIVPNIIDYPMQFYGTMLRLTAFP